MLIDWLLAKGATVRVHDPEAMDNVRGQYGDKSTIAQKPMPALDGADALAIMTEWGDYQRPEFNEISSGCGRPVIFDGRNLYEPGRWSGWASSTTASAARPWGSRSASASRSSETQIANVPLWSAPVLLGSQHLRRPFC